MNRQSHYFFAIELPKALKESLDDWSLELKQKYSYKSWVHPSDYHITIAFLGSAPQSLLDEAVNLLNSGANDLVSFPLEVSGLGTFGMENRPRILWADIRKQPQLYEIQKFVWTACTNTGFILDSKPFTPHITLARRCQENIDISKFRQMEESLPSIPEFMVEHLVLYRTNSQTIPKYEPIVRFPLG